MAKTKTFEGILTEEYFKLQNKVVKAEEGYKKLNLQESFQLISNLENLQGELYDEQNHIPQEHWTYFTDTLKKLNEHELFIQFSKLIMCKLYALKLSTKITFASNENLENELKFELKNYISTLRSAETEEEFIEMLIDLPFEFTALLIRYNANILCPELKDKLSPNIKTAEEFVNYIDEMKNNLIVQINKLSRGEVNTLSIKDLKELFDVRVFYDDIDINAGVCEYVIRMLLSEKSSKTIRDEFGRGFLERLKEQTLLNTSYINFLERIAENQEQPFFKSNGLQNKEREVSFNDLVTKLFYPNSYIPRPEPSTDINTPEALEPQSEELAPEENTKENEGTV